MAVIYDIFSKIPLLCECSSTLISHERALLYAMLSSVSKNMLLVLDRGYQSYWLFDAFIKNSIQFFCRVKDNFNYKIVRKISKNNAAMIVSVIIRFFMRESSETHSVEFDEISFKNSVFLFSIFLYIFDYNNNFYNIFISLISLNKNKIRNDRHFPRIFYKKILKRVVL